MCCMLTSHAALTSGFLLLSPPRGLQAQPLWQLWTSDQAACSVQLLGKGERADSGSVSSRLPQIYVFSRSDCNSK